MREPQKPAAEWLPTRESLLTRLKDWEDKESWAEFVQTYGNLIYRTAIKSGLTRDEAEDVVQDTLLKVSKSMKDFEYKQEGSFKNWLLQLTRWRIADQFAKRQQDIKPPSDRHDLRTATIDRVPDPNGAAIEKDWQEDWEKNLLELAIRHVKRKIDPVKYQIFDLCVRQNLSPQKVAKLTKTNIGSVYLTKHRIGNLLKKEIQRLQTKLI